MEQKRVLLLSSYCGDNNDCTENNPCIECLSMCNVFKVDDDAIKMSNYIETLEYLGGNIEVKKTLIELQLEISLQYKHGKIKTLEGFMRMVNDRFKRINHQK